MAGLPEVLRSPGPCLTLLAPSYHPGEPTEPGAALVTTYLQDAERQLAHRPIPEAGIRSLLEPLEELAKDPAWLSGTHVGCVIFRSPGVFRQYRLRAPVKPSVTVGGCFAIRRILRDLCGPRLFYILALSKESVGLFRCADGEVEAEELPGGTPRTLEEAMAFEPPDHDLENRSAAGPSSNARSRIRFGTGSGRETKHAHLADFYKIVDRGIQTLLHEPEFPIVLAGVEEDIAIYRAASTYRGLAREHLGGSPNLLRQTAETAMRAAAILCKEELQREGKAMREAMERTAPGRFSTDPHTIVHAAFDGRVRELYMDENAERDDVFERRTYRSWGKEDLLNLAAVETTLHGGKARELPSETMPRGAAVVAILRF